MTSYPTVSSAPGAPLRAVLDRRTDTTVARTRGLFALGFLALTTIEFVVTYGSSRPVELWAHALWRSFYSAGIDAGSWWCCIAMAEAFAFGTRRSWRYAIATLLASAIALLLHSLTQTWLFESPYGKAAREPFVVWWQVGFVGLWRLSVLTIAYCYRLQLLSGHAVLARARLDRSTLARKTAESKLRILQARVDPRLLFDALADVERHCDADPSRADATLDRLVTYLRAALPQALDRPSTLGTEIELVRAYLSLVGTRSGRSVTLDVNLDMAVLHDIAMAPMLLLPVVQEELRASGGKATAVDMQVATCGDRVEVAVCLRGEAPDVRDPGGLPPSLLTRLAGIYGSTASLQRRANAAGGFTVTLSIPHEHAARTDR